MTSHGMLKFFLSLVTFAAMSLAAGRAHAADQYCAQRIMVWPTSECFNTLEEAEAFIRVEPTPADGSKYLELTFSTPISLGYFSNYYSVKPRAYEAFVGSLYVSLLHRGLGKTISMTVASHRSFPVPGCKDVRTSRPPQMDSCSATRSQGATLARITRALT